MKKILLAISVVCMAIFASCNKEDLSTNASSQEGFNVSIIAEMGEFAATKSTAESCIRLKWEAGDKVYAYGSTGSSIDSLGCLTVALEDDNAYVALMSGTLTQIPSDGKLYLVHCPLLTAGPSISGGAISISLASQPADCIPFVAYATVTEVSATTQSSLKATFKFASSVIKANVYGIANSTKMSMATLSDVNTACKITFGETIAVAGETAGTITKTLNTSSSASGKADFYIAVPAIEASTSRYLTVKAGDVVYIKDGAVTKAHGYNAYVNTICDLTDITTSHPNAYVDEQGNYYGDGTAITTGTPSVTTVWAPVNCGYDAGHTYGLLYQWGRKYGDGYDGEPSYETRYQYKYGVANTQVDGTNVIEDPTIVYWGEYLPHCDWLATKDDTRWNSGSEESPSKNSSYDPCPTGWRVPTCSELTALYGDNADLDIVTVGGQYGAYFNGTSPCTQKTEGDKVFLPSAGWYTYDEHIASGRKEGGYFSYWSSSAADVNYYDYDEEVLVDYYGAKVLMCFGGNSQLSIGQRANCFSVRCVQE